jgi:hypothetical protein
MPIECGVCFKRGWAIPVLAPAEPLIWILTYTPVLQFFILYLWFYRYEPTRLFHPSREKKGLKAWVDVLTQLKLIDGNVKVKGENVALKYAIRLFSPTALLSLVCAALLAPALQVSFPVLSRFSAPLLFLLQFIPAFYSLLYLRKVYLGPLPLRYLKSVVPLPRQSSLVRHLGDRK